jgi:transcriptional regulator with XRE-family HTH domain
MGRGLTQDDVASALNTSTRNISRWESGSHEPGAWTMMELLNLIRGSADDVQSLVAGDCTEEDATRLAREYVDHNPGQVVVSRPQTVFNGV